MRAEDLRAQLLRLPEKTRAELAMELLDSLSPTTEGDDERLIDEIEARVDQALSGSTGSTWDEVRERLESRFGR